MAADETIDVNARIEYLDGEDSTGPIDHYAVPETLLQRQFQPTETRFQHPVIPIESRVILSGPAEARNYGPVFAAVERRFPIRAARLRDLHSRVATARERFLERQGREEQLRHVLNEHANYINRQVSQDLGERRAGYEAQRPALVQEIQRLEEQQALLEAPHREAIGGLEQSLAAVRLQHAEARHALLSEAEIALDQAEAAAIRHYQPAIDAAAAERDRLRLELSLHLQEEEKALTEAARELEHALHAEAVRREEQLHGVQRTAAELRAEREARLQQIRKEAATVTAAAGLLPEEARDNPREQLRSRVDEAAVLAGAEVEYPEAPAKPNWRHDVASAIATAACGSIFGLSLAFVTGILRSFSSVSAQWGKTGLVLVLGTFVFWLIGELVERATTLASEVQHSGADRRVRYLTLGAGALVLLVLIVIEMFVERYGIVEAAIKGTTSYALGESGGDQPEIAKGGVGWFVAAIVVVPFVLSHAYRGWMETRYRIAARQRRGLVARAQRDCTENPEFEAFVAAVHHSEHAERHLAETPDPDTFPEVQLARRRVEEVQRQREGHPVLVRAQGLPDELQRRLEGDPRVRHAEARLQAAREALESEPSVQAARRQLERLKSAPETTLQIMELEHALAATRSRFERDPAVQAANIRVRQAQIALNHLEELFGTEKTRLEKQRRYLRHAPDKHMRARIQDAREEWQAAQLLFDAELALVMRLLECPRYLLWWEHLRLYFSPQGFASLSAASAPAAGPVLAVRSNWRARVGKAAAGTLGSTALIWLVARMLFR